MFARPKTFPIISISVFIVITVTTTVYGEWAECGIPISTAELRQSTPRICPDGFGGTIISWTSGDEGGFSDIYIQRVDGDGNIQWDENGMPVRVAEGCQRNMSVIPDGFGGAVVVWLEGCLFEEWDIRASRINNLGHLVGPVEGYPICTAPNKQTQIGVLPDGESGAYIIWEDWRSGARQVYAQRIDEECNPLWQQDGIPVCTPTGQAYPRAVPDSDGGVIVAWQDYRNGYIYIDNWDIFVQRIDRHGSLLWGNDGVPICTLPSKQINQEIASDGSGGAYICWTDDRDHLGYNDIFVQKIDSSGAIQWDEGGLPACNAEGTRWHPNIVADSHGGAVVVWYDYKQDVYAQVIHPDGSMEYGTSGYGVCTAPGDQRSRYLCNNGYGDIIIAWSDYRSLPGKGYIQLLDRNGVFRWDQDGVPICPVEEPLAPPIMSHDGCGGIVGVWVDESQNMGDLFARKLFSYTVTDALDVPSTIISMGQNYPNPFNPSTTVEYYLPERRKVVLEIFDVTGRLIYSQNFGFKDAGAHRMVWNGRNAYGNRVASGTYLYRLISGKDTITRKMILLR